MNGSDVGAIVPSEHYRPFLPFCQYYFGSTMDYPDDERHHSMRVWPAGVYAWRPGLPGLEPR